MVWIESIASTAGRSRLGLRRGSCSSVGLGGRCSDRRRTPSRPARIAVCRPTPRPSRRGPSCRARASRRAPGAAASTCRCPGSPPSSTSEPATSAAAEDAVELADARLHARRMIDLYRPLYRAWLLRSRSPRRRVCPPRRLLDERIPLAALGTAAEPLAPTHSRNADRRSACSLLLAPRVSASARRSREPIVEFDDERAWNVCAMSGESLAYCAP